MPSWKLVGGVFGLGFFLLTITFLVAYAATDLPPESAQIEAQTTIIYYSDGKQEIARVSAENRQSVKLGAVPKPVQNAVLAAEDQTFWENSGVSPRALVRAAISNAKGGNTQGGSTITQQYVKNVYDLRDRTIKRKAREFFIALKINRKIDKTEILERYLNTIYMGRGAYGIQAASQAYFGSKHTVDKLTVSEGAFLAGLINAPEDADPKDGGEERAKFRWGVVLDAMVAEGDLSAADRAKQVFPKVRDESPSGSLSGQKGYLVKMALAEASKRLNIPEDKIKTGGYTITTTFVRQLVRDAEKAVKDKLGPSVPGRPKGLRVGLVNIDPATGAVRAIYGGPDYVTESYNNASQSIAEAGSTFKPFGLVAALEDGVSLDSRFSGRSPMDFTGAKEPIKNFGNESLRTMDLVDATAKSVNTIYVALNKEVGPEKTREAAIAAGIPEDTKGLENNLVNVLGSASPRVIDMAAAYSTFAAGGVRHDPFVIKQIGLVGGKAGAVLPLVKPEGKPVFKKDVIDDLTYAMQAVVKRGSGTYAQELNRPVAGKTGTSSGSRSAWFVGFTPDSVTAVAMFAENEKGIPIEMEGFGGFRSITGGSFPVRIWTQFMEAALKGKPTLEFDPPSNGGKFIGTPVPVAPPPPTTTATTPSETTTPGETTGPPNPGETTPDAPPTDRNPFLPDLPPGPGLPTP